MLSVFWLIIAAIILNYSIDVPDPYNDFVEEDLSYNDIESITELIFEYGFGWENFVPEHDDNDSDSGMSIVKKIDIVVVPIAVTFKAAPSCLISFRKHFFVYAISNPEKAFIPGVHKPPQA